MKITSLLARRYLYAQKRRSAAVLISLFLSLALITGIGVMAGSISQGRIDQALELSGKYHIQVPRVTFEEVEQLKSLLIVDKVGVMAGFGGVRVQDRYTISLESYDKAALSMTAYELKEGRFPEKADEIVLENWMAEMLGLTDPVGRTVSFTVLHEAGSKRNTQFWEQEHTFTVCGIIAENPVARISATSVGILSLDAYTNIIDPESHMLYPFVWFKPEIEPIEGQAIVQEHLNLSEKDIHTNTGLFDAMYQKNELSLPSILLIFLVAGVTSIAIYNIFNIAVLERVQNLGMIRSVGAGPKQVFELVLKEALLYSLIALLPGLAGGILVAYGFSSLLYTSMNIPPSYVYLSPAILAGCGALGFIITLISALKPALSASRLTPLTAIKGAMDQTALPAPKNGLLKRMIQKIWGISGVMAYQNLFRNRKKAVTTIVGIAIIVLLLTGFGFFNRSFDNETILAGMFPGDFEIANSYYGDSSITGEFLTTIEELPEVESVVPFMLLTADVCVPVSKADDYLLENEDLSGLDEIITNSNVYGYSNETRDLMDAKLLDGFLDWNEFETQPVVWVGNGDRSKYKPGDTVEFRLLYNGKESSPLKLKIAGLLNHTLYHFSQYSIGPEIILHEDQLSKIIQEQFPKEPGLPYKKMMINIDPEVEFGTVQPVLESLIANDDKLYLNSLEKTAQMIKKQEHTLSILILTIILVIVIIGSFSIVNTVATSLLLRSREYGTIRSVGMSSGQIKKMLAMEGALYGIIGGFWGTIGGLIFGIVWSVSMKAGGAHITFRFPVGEVLLVWAAVTGISTLSAFVPARRIVSTSIVGSIRAVE